MGNDVGAPYVLQEGIQSSYTIPLHHQGAFLAFMFFDSREKDTFSEPVRRELQIYAPPPHMPTSPTCWRSSRS
jgi:hypothetical protein